MADANTVRNVEAHDEMKMIDVEWTFYIEQWLFGFPGNKAIMSLLPPPPPLPAPPTTHAPPTPRRVPSLIPLLLLPLSLTLIAHPLLSAARASPTLSNSLLRHLPIPQASPSFPALEACAGFSLAAFVAVMYAVPGLAEAFMHKGFHGRDLLKGDKGEYMYVSTSSSFFTRAQG